MRSIHLALVALPALVGCAELRTTYTPANGEPMHVHDQTVLRTGTQRVATGQDEVRDSQGNLVATNTHYENQQVSWTEREWFPLQGNARVDDESFYRITGDKDAVAKYDNYHQAGMSRNSVGWVVLGVGAGVFGAGAVGYAVGGPTVDPNTGAESGGGLRTAGYIGMTAGLITAVVGTLLVVSGKHAAHAEDVRLFDEPERMKGDARRYNEQLGMTSQGTSAAAIPAPAPSPSPLVARPGAPIAVSPFTASITKDKIKKIELKPDGSIFADGKKVAAIDGSDVKDTQGNTLFTVLADGSLKGDDLPNSKMRVDDDGLVRGDNKVTVSDDGTIVLVKKSGVETVGHIDKGSRQKRTAVLVLAAVATAQRQ